MDTAVGCATLPRVFVISDVHVGAGECDDFDSVFERQLVRFLQILGRLPQQVHLVINGDFFDFATAAPWDDPHLESTTAHGLPLCFTEEQSRRKLDNIVASHGPVFDALAGLLAARPGNRITMLPGNHDADLFWPLVRQGIHERVAAALPSAGAIGRFAFVLERQIVVERYGKRYWIEHGHQHDPQNRFFPDGVERWSAAGPPVFLDHMQHWRLYECPGTLGLVRHINRWRPQFRSISYIKPYSKVLRALIETRTFKQPGRPLMVLGHLVAMLGWDVDLQTALVGDADVKQACHAELRKLAGNLSAREEAELKRELAARGLHIGIPLRLYVSTSERCESLIDLIARGDTGKVAIQPPEPVAEDTLQFITSGLADDAETRALLQMARRLVAQRKADYVVTGHTHGPCQLDHGRFTNGGCWIPNQEVSSKAAAQKILFKRGPVSYRLSYVEVRLPGAPRLRSFGRGKIVV